MIDLKTNCTCVRAAGGQKLVCEGLRKISRNFTLHLIKVGKLKRFKKVSSNLKTILMTSVAKCRGLWAEVVCVGVGNWRG